MFEYAKMLKNWLKDYLNLLKYPRTDCTNIQINLECEMTMNTNSNIICNPFYSNNLIIVNVCSSLGNTVPHGLNSGVKSTSDKKKSFGSQISSKRPKRKTCEILVFKLNF